eukprot:CAMPEP_0202396096 /NCGR_PEP_ID=MMETSP1127-20130417/94322_1 /ASSEMBLY_ACC=CAM_ASM_000462 /TAXON_ID=3047 /ORGANISM="Dunaliella tertiolecta, Strain CCMP1320" /LENGTH=86 /DNA_ID=CAMNT_0048998845 /DNA_START=415 /DNA_END=675 /DNA_ORIENTATION=-
MSLAEGCVCASYFLNQAVRFLLSLGTQKRESVKLSMGCAHGERQQPQVYIIPRDLCLPPGTAGGCDLEPLPFQAEAFVGVSQQTRM